MSEKDFYWLPDGTRVRKGFVPASTVIDSDGAARILAERDKKLEGVDYQGIFDEIERRGVSAFKNLRPKYD